MKIIRWSSDMELPNNIALIIGNFDGVHIGHQQMLNKLKTHCELMNLTACALSFFPHPQKIIQGRSNDIISQMHDRAYWLEHYGLQYWIVLPFTAQFRSVSAQKFIESYLLERLKVRYLLVGDDFRFGFQGQGDYRLLSEYDALKAEKLPAIIDNKGQRISSSLIRESLKNHDVDLASHLLGHDITFTGRVRRGSSRGRELSARTANLHVSEDWCLANGVYIVKLKICEQSKETFWGVANLGTAPTFMGYQRKLEVHVLNDNCPDLYDKKVQVSIKHFIRDEQRFDDKIALQTQIFKDVQTANAFIAQQLQGK